MSATPNPRVTIVVAYAANGVIGRDGAMPWRLPADLRHFKALTTGHALVMGRRTFESIGRPLPGRRTIVVTRDTGWHHDGCETAGSIDDAITLAARPGPDPSIATDEVFVVGGGEIYRAARARAARIVATEIGVAIDGDTYFEQPADGWTEVARRPLDAPHGWPVAVVDYRRSPTPEP